MNKATEISEGVPCYKGGSNLGCCSYLLRILFCKFNFEKNKFVIFINLIF